MKKYQQIYSFANTHYPVRHTHLSIDRKGPTKPLRSYISFSFLCWIRRQSEGHEMNWRTLSSSSPFHWGSIEIAWLFLVSKCMRVHIRMCEGSDHMWQFYMVKATERVICCILYSMLTSISNPLLFCGGVHYFSLFITCLLYPHCFFVLCRLSSPLLRTALLCTPLLSSSEHQSHFQWQQC